MPQLLTYSPVYSKGGLQVDVLWCPRASNERYQYQISGFQTQGPGKMLLHSSSHVEIVFQSNQASKHVPDGVSVDSLLRVLIDRLCREQASTRACSENARAIALLERASKHASGSLRSATACNDADFNAPNAC